MSNLKCIVCDKKVTFEDKGTIVNQVIGWAGNIPKEKYIAPIVAVFHNRCEDKARKILMKLDEERHRKMGLID